jgi:hypothetical protein
MAFGLGSSSSGGMSSGGIDNEKIEGAVIESVLFHFVPSPRNACNLCLSRLTKLFSSRCRLDMMTDVFNRMVSSVYSFTPPDVQTPLTP